MVPRVAQCPECRQHTASSSRAVGSTGHHTATMLQAEQLPQWGAQKRAQPWTASVRGREGGQEGGRRDVAPAANPSPALCSP